MCDVGFICGNDIYKMCIRDRLRIIAMYMIVFIHANLNLSTFCGGKSMIFFNGLVNGICNIGVTCFILISGYYGVQFKLKKLVKMECMMISYSLLEILLMYLVMPEQLQGAAPVSYTHLDVYKRQAQ